MCSGVRPGGCGGAWAEACSGAGAGERIWAWGSGCSGVRAGEEGWAWRGLCSGVWAGGEIWAGAGAWAESFSGVLVSVSGKWRGAMSALLILGNWEGVSCLERKGARASEAVT